MNGLVNTTEKKDPEEEFDFKNYFVPLTNTKAITWIVIVGFIVYGNMLFNGFVWDDFVFILNPPDIHTFDIAHLFGLNIFNNLGYYRAISAAYFSLLYSLFNTQPFFYHIIQLCFHIINACLVFFLFKKFFNIKISFFISLVFLLHPIQVESVSFIAASQNELFVFFGMTALLLEIYKKHSLRVIVIQFVLLLLSCLTKETGFLFIALLLLYQCLFNRKKIVNILPYLFGVITVYSILRFVYAGDYLVKNVTSSIGTLTISERLINIPSIIFYYIKTFVYPAQLAIDQRWTVSSSTFLTFYILLITDLIFFFFLGVLGVYLHKKNTYHFKLFIFFSLWFLLGMILLLQLFPLDMTVADRWFYFPIIGLLGIIGLVLTQFKFKNIKASHVSCVIVTIVIVLLSARTIVRNSNFIDYETLLTHDAQVMNNYDIEYNLGALLYYEKKYPQALQHALKSYKIYPYDYSLLNIGSMYEAMGNNEKAKESYAQALAMKKSYNSSHKHYLIFYIKYICVLLLYDNPNNANEQITIALNDYPQAWQLWELKALVYYKLDRNKEAFATAKNAQELFPNMYTKIFYEYINNKPPKSINDYKNITTWILSLTGTNG